MTINRLLAIGAVLLSFAAGPVWAQGVTVEQVIDQLRDQGYSEIRISRTFLGRSRIVATSDEYRREIVINPSTGAILRDYWVVLDRDEVGEDRSDRRIVNPALSDDGDDGGASAPSGGSSGGSDDDDDDRDDDKDDDGGSDDGGSDDGGSDDGGSDDDGGDDDDHDDD